MSIIVFDEMPGSRKICLDPPTATLRYVCQGEFSSAVVAAHAINNTAPLFTHPLGILHRQRQGFEVEETDWCRYEITVPYGRSEMDAGTYELDLDTGGGTVNVKAGTFIKLYDANGSSDTSRNGGLIGVKDGGREVDGVDLPIEEAILTVTFRHPAGFFSPGFGRIVSRMAGCVNSTNFGGYLPGEVKFLNARAKVGTNVETEVQYKYAISENLTNYTLAGIPNVSKKGWEIASVYWAEDVVGGKPGAKADYIEIVRPGAKPWVDFVAIFGFDPV